MKIFNSSQNSFATQQNDETRNQRQENRVDDATSELIQKTPDNERIVNKKIIEIKTPKESLQEWWDLGKYHFNSTEEMPKLDEFEIDLLFTMLKSTQKELKASPSKKIENSFVKISDGDSNSLKVEFMLSHDVKDGRYIYWSDGKYHHLPLKRMDLERFFGGFILSQEKSFFAFSNVWKGFFAIFPNRNYTITQEIEMEGLGTLYTREGHICLANDTEWKIGDDSICRLVKRPQVLDNSSVKNKATKKAQENGNKILTNKNNEIAEKTKTQKKSLEDWWKLGENRNNLDHFLPYFSDKEIDTLYNWFKSIEDQLIASQFKTIENSIVRISEGPADTLKAEIKYSDRDHRLTFDNGTKMKLMLNDFKRFFGGFVLSQEKSFFAWAWRIGTCDFFTIFPNKDRILNENIMDKHYIIFTREGEVQAKNSEWKIGDDSVCRLVKKNTQGEIQSSIMEDKIETTEISSIEEYEISDKNASDDDPDICITM